MASPLHPQDHLAESGRAAADDTRCCAACGSVLAEPFFLAEAVPVANSRMFASAREAVTAASGRLELCRCGQCGFAQNVAFDANRVEYAEGYEDTQAHSPRFVSFAETTIRRQVARYGLAGAATLEIGCGKADWLRLTCRATGGPGIGIDPALSVGALDDDDLDIRLIARSYGPGDAHLTGDLVVCRHTLEHLPDVSGFLTMMRANMIHRPDTVVFIEVPDTARILREGAFWDLFYEHCSYFDQASLVGLAERVGFDVLDSRVDYDGQYLLLEALVGSAPAPCDVVGSAEPGATDRFGSAVAAWISEIEARFTAAAASGRRIALWGAGSKAVGLLTIVRSARAAPYVIDINPRKQGRHLAGTGHRVVGPDDITGDPVDEIILLNPVYLDEVRREIARVGATATITAIA